MSKDMLGSIVRQLVLLPAEMLGSVYDLLQKLTGSNGQAWFQGLKKLLREEYIFDSPDIRQDWQEFYRRYFRMTVDFSGVSIPDNPGGFDRVIFIPQGLKLSQVIEALRKKFKVWTYVDDLDKDVTNNVRTTNQSYAVRCRDRQEADEELKNTSANELKDQGVNTLTLLERLVYELKYFSETGEHLDVQNWTLCAGSRYSNGHVPFVDWYPVDRQLRVDWCSPDDAFGGLRARQAVS